MEINKINILLVDFSKLYLGILQQQVHMNGAVLHHASNAAQALEMAGSQEFAFIITVARLEDMSGIELVSKLRKTPQHDRCPIVILTGSASEISNEVVNARGVTEIFRKQDIEELVFYMRRFLASRNILFGRVLYVEDDKSQRLLLSEQLQKWGLTVDAVGNADEAWPLFTKTDYDLVITDIELDGQMTGSRFINRIRRLAPTRGDTPVLAMTAFDSEARRFGLFHLGASDYVTKPYLQEELYARIGNLISGKIAAERDHKLLAATSVGVVTADFTGMIESVNTLVLEMFGYEEHELLGQNVNILVPEPHHSAHDGYIQHYLESGQRQVLNVVERELEAVRKDGSLFPIKLTVNDMQQGGRRILAGLIRDITEQKDVEKVLHDGRLMALEASRAKSEFLANMSHEIRTPMNGVIGMTEVLLNSKLNDEQKKMASVIHESAHAQLAILNDILDFSKIEAGKLELVEEPFELTSIIDKVSESLSGHARELQVEITTDIDSAIPQALQGDALRLRQVLMNLTTNAIKFSSGTMRDARVEVSARLMRQKQQKYWIEVSVRDNGIGMDEDTRLRLFHPFSQADSSTTRKYGGTGLGLVISMRLVEAMQGKIEVQSQPDVGSTFSAILPFEAADPESLHHDNQFEEVSIPAADLPSRDDAIKQGRLILVVEDNKTNQQVISYQLSVLGYQCDVAADGLQALEMWQSDEYALILTDIHMPKLDGYQLAMTIRKEEQKKNTASVHIPILALTANVLKGEAERCHDAGMDSYLAKPVPLSQLAGELTGWLGIQAEQNDSVPENIASPSSSKGQSEFPLFDGGMLTKMVGDNPVMQQRLLKKFVDNFQEKSQALMAAMDSTDFKETAAIAHSLKSASRSVGAMQLGQLCEQLEKAGKENDRQEVGRLLPVFEQAMIATMNEIKSFLKSR